MVYCSCFFFLSGMLGLVLLDLGVILILLLAGGLVSILILLFILKLTLTFQDNKQTHRSTIIFCVSLIGYNCFL